MPDKVKIVDRLRKIAGKMTNVYLAPDPDREGEAIAAHLRRRAAPVSPKNSIQRVTFNEITPRRRCGRRSNIRARWIAIWSMRSKRGACWTGIVGYQISPLLWDKVRRGLSAGRVQTVALRLIVEREREIKAFKPVEYWTIDADSPEAGAKDENVFTARFVGIDGESAKVDTVSGNALPDERIPKTCCAAIEKANWSVARWSARSAARIPQRHSPPAAAAGCIAAAWFLREAHDGRRATAV